MNYQNNKENKSGDNIDKKNDMNYSLNSEFSNKFIQKHSELSKSQLIELLDEINEILVKEPKLIVIPRSRVFFLGDTHGEFSITLHGFKHFKKLKIDEHENDHHSQFDKLVFLGDFVDRGPYSIENVNFLMSMKRMFPDDVILIRGNHETKEINARFNFYEQVIRRYGLKVFEKYNQVFSKLPLAVLTWNNIFAVHGGIPENLEHLSDLNGLDDEIDPEDRITFQILWNDPVEKDGWFFTNFRGKYSKKFGKDAFEYFIKKHNIRLFLRAHEIQKRGYKNYFNARLISLDSSQKRDMRKMKVFILEPDGEYEVKEFEFYNKKMKIF